MYGEGSSFVTMNGDAPGIWQPGARRLNSAMRDATKKYLGNSANCAPLINSGRLWLSNFFEQDPQSTIP